MRRSQSGDLTPRELDCLRAYAAAGDQGAAAASLGIAPQTLKNHLGDAYHVLEVRGAIDAFRRLGWLAVPE